MNSQQTAKCPGRDERTQSWNCREGHISCGPAGPCIILLAFSTFVCLAVCSSGACWTKADVDDVYSFDNSKPASCVVFSLLRGVVYPPLSDCTQFVYRCRIAICAQRGSSSVL